MPARFAALVAVPLKLPVNVAAVTVPLKVPALADTVPVVLIMEVVPEERALFT